jgi:hypothetical protein
MRGFSRALIEDAAEQEDIRLSWSGDDGDSRLAQAARVALRA